jgi:phage terminase large subunit-like protein
MPFSEEKAAKAVGFIQNRCRHTRGEYAGRRFKLALWQRDGIIRPLFGTVNEHGLRQYRTAFVSRARKNGKSEEGTALALYLLCGDGERGAEVYSAAGDREQAAIVFNTAAQMVRLDPVLSKRCRVIDSTKRILYEDRVYRALSAEAYSKQPSTAYVCDYNGRLQPQFDLLRNLRLRQAGSERYGRRSEFLCLPFRGP